ncbi:MAG: MFS transporter, partial [Chloroflexi bacterium]|nr:MFS transporter [Chloroflexota bacterium]
SDILGRRRMLLLGAFFFAAPPFFYLLVSNPYSLLGLRFVHGLATAIFSPVASAAVADLFQRDRGEKLGWFASANEFGSAFGPLLGGVILALSPAAGLFRFQLTYLIVGAIGAVTFVLALLLPIGTHGPVPGPAPDQAGPKVGRWTLFIRGAGEVIGNRGILIASSAESAMFLGVGALLGFLPLYARNVLKLGDAYLGVLIWVPLVMAMAGKPVAGRISDRIGRKRVILAGLSLCVVTLPLIPITGSFAALLVEGALFGLGMAIVTPSTNALVADLCKAGSYGAAMGVFGTIWDIGEALGPILAGVIIAAFGGLSDASSYFMAFGIIAAILVVAAIAFAVAVEEPKGVAQPAL